MSDNIKYEKDPKLFNYSENENRDLGYHSPRLSGTDKGLIAAFELLNAADWTQMQEARRDPRYAGHDRESDFSHGGSSELIGKRPSRDKINAMIGTEALVYPVIVSNLKEPWRSIFQALMIGGKAAAVNNNKSIGVDAYRW
jgi:hypothetical protein